jgi:excisionase family DNA binding protein
MDDAIKRNWRNEEFINAKDIARILNVHLNTAYEIIHQMPHIKIGSTYRVAVPAFEKWIRDKERSSMK